VPTAFGLVAFAWRPFIASFFWLKVKGEERVVRGEGFESQKADCDGNVDEPEVTNTPEKKESEE
jgi:hypothetical protein